MEERLIQIIHKCTQSTLARARRALPPRKIFYWRGSFAKVRAIDYKTCTIWLYDVEQPVRRNSIDDCSPAEWHDAIFHNR